LEKKILSMRELSDKLGVSVFAVYGWLKKDPPCPSIQQQYGPGFIEADVRQWHLNHCRQIRKFALKAPEED